MEISQIKQQLPIGQVLSYYGLKPDRNGMLNCPFHQDKTPSLQVYGKTNSFCCFSSNCSAGTGDVIDFIQLKEGSSKHQALVKATELASVPGPAPGTDQGLPRQAVLGKFWQSSQKSLQGSNRAREYASSRNLDWQQLEVGFCSSKLADSWNSNLKQSAERYGLLHKRTTGGKLEPRLKDCLVFPLKNKEGQPVSFYGRSILATEANPSAGRHFYLKDRQGLYPNYPKDDTNKLILTESIIDAATLWQQESIQNKYGILALYGTNGLNSEHIKAIADLPQLEEIILFMDGDEAGKAAAEKHRQTLQALLPAIKISQVQTPENEDVNSLLEAHSPEVYNHLLENRIFFSSKEIAPDEAVETRPEPAETEPEPTTPLQADQYGLRYTTEVASYRISGKLPVALDSLKVSLAIEALDSPRKYRSKPDLYEDKQVSRIAREASEKLNLPVHELQHDLEELTDLLESYRQAQLDKPNTHTTEPGVSSAIVQKAVELLKKPDLLSQLNNLIEQAGVVGEEKARLFLLPITLSARTKKPLHALIQGSSGSGKTHLLSMLSSFYSAHQKEHFTRVTDSSLYNWGPYDLQHKILFLEDLDGLKEEALFAFRELQSRGQISSSTSVKDEQGNISAQAKTVYGPIASLACTTRGEVYEDNMSRCFLVAVDESKAQTARIIEYQNRKAAGLIDSRQEEQARQLIQVALQQIKPLPVLNPYATKLTLPEAAHKQRRLNELYQSYVQQLTLLHQYQRQKDSQGRLVTTKEDLRQAADLMFDTILLKVDELNGPLRQFFEQLKDLIKDKAQEFSQREVRQALRISKTQLHRFLHELMQLEYIQLSGGYGNRGYRYKISYWDSLEVLKSQIKTHIDSQLAKL